MNQSIRNLFLTFTLLFLFFALIVIGSFEAMAKPISLAPDQILVKFKSGADIANIHAINKTNTLKVISKINVHVVSIPPGQDIQKVIERFKKNRNVEYAEPDYIVGVDLVPNDPEFSKQWNLNNTGQTGGTPDADIDAPEAWNTQLVLLCHLAIFFRFLISRE